MHTLTALASEVIGGEQGATTPRRSRTPKRAAPKRAAPKRGKRAQAAEAVAIAVPATGRDSSREALEGVVEAALARAQERLKDAGDLTSEEIAATEASILNSIAQLKLKRKRRTI
jgi:hypothetical protein